MQIIKGLEHLNKRYKDVVLTIGNFDGVHIGHQKIFRAVAERAAALAGTAMAITFDPHPLRVVAPEKGVKTMTPFHEKARLMKFYGMDVVLCINFNSGFSTMEPDNFIKDVIVDRIGACEVIVGHNYAFGKGKRGTTEILRRRGKKYGFDLRVVRNARLHGDVVSSSRVRSLLSRGRVCEASRLLGRPYMIEGRVIRGAGRGAGLLNIPTANIETPNELVPKEGVYAVKAGLGGKVFDGVANIGKNPTFGENKTSYEIHIFDFSENIFGKELKVFFIDRLRDEKRFPDINALHESIMRDIGRAGDILNRGKYPKLI